MITWRNYLEMLTIIYTINTKWAVNILKLLIDWHTNSSLFLLMKSVKCTLEIWYVLFFSSFHGSCARSASTYCMLLLCRNNNCQYIKTSPTTEGGYVKCNLHKKISLYHIWLQIGMSLHTLYLWLHCILPKKSRYQTTKYIWTFQSSYVFSISAL